MAIDAADPAPAAVITCARGSTTLPAAQTPGCWFDRWRQLSARQLSTPADTAAHRQGGRNVARGPNLRAW